jgi:Zn-finger protein
METILSGLLDQVLGYGEKASKSNRKYHCPFPDCPTYGTHKKKLEVDILTDSEGSNKWACWVCGSRGRTVRSLLRKIGVSPDILKQLSTIIVKTDREDEDAAEFDGVLPSEYKFLLDAKPYDILAKHAMIYLKKRGVTEQDIIKYQIGYCEEGKYAERIIMPSFDANGKINFFVGRSFDPEVKLKYKYPQASRDIIPFEMYINWDIPVVLCEGGFDMLAIKRNAIPLLGKFITPKLMKKLVEAKIKKVYIALDNDAIVMALKHCETLMSLGKKVYLVEMKDKDPSSMGFEAFLSLIQTVQPLTLDKLLKYKMLL